MIRLTIVATLAFLLPGPLSGATAATWLVDGTSPNASDIGQAPDGRPLRTIGRAAELAGPGDIVRVRAGLYRETILLPRSGRADAPIRFVADPPGSVVLTGADPLERLARDSGPEPIFSVPWTRRFVAGRDRTGGLVEHHPASEPLWGRAEQVIADGELLLPAATLEDLRRAWQARKTSLRPPVPGVGGPFAGMFAIDPAGGRLHLWLRDGANPADRRLEASTRALLVAPHPQRRSRGVDYVSLEGFVFRYAANFPQRAAVLLEGKGNVLSNCTVEYMNGAGLSVHGTLRDCRVRHNGHVGGSAEGANFLNERVVWEGNSWKPIDRNWEAGGAKLTQEGPGEFRDCTFRRNGGPGLWFDLDAHDIVVRRSRFVENEDSGVFVEISRDISIIDNVMSGNAAGSVGGSKKGSWGTGGVAIAESLRVTVLRNVIEGNLDGISLREQGPRRVTKQAGGTIDYHNAGHDIGDNRIAANLRYALALWWDNSFFGPHPSAPNGSEAPYDPKGQDIRIDGNRYIVPSGATPFLYGVPWRPLSRRFDDLRALAAATGFESSGTLAPR